MFWRDNVPGMAGMIAFFGFLSIVPLTLLLLAVGGHVLGGALSVSDVRTLFRRVMPGLSQQQFLQTYWDPIRHSRVATTVLGVVSLVFGTLGLHDSIDWAVNRLWRTPGAHSFWIAKVRGIAVILWVTVFAVISLGLASASALVIGLTHALSVPGAIIALTPALVLDIAVFTALYTLTPTVKVRVRCAFPAAVLGAIFWGVSKIVFGWWVLQAGTYNRVYGPLGGQRHCDALVVDLGHDFPVRSGALGGNPTS